MKKIAKFVAFAALNFTALNLHASPLETLLQGSKFSGEIGAYSETRRVISGTKTTYFNDTSWLVGSAALNYELSFLDALKLGIGGRGSVPIYEGDRNYRTLHGKGDSTERIYEGDRALLSQLFLGYDDGVNTLKIGRFEMINDWSSKIQDGVRVTSEAAPNLLLDASYSKRRGRAYLKEMWGFTKLNEGRGIFNAGATYKQGGASVKIYALYASELFSALGGKISYESGGFQSGAGEMKLGWMLHYARSDERKQSGDGSLAEAKIYGVLEGTKLTLAYVKSGKSVGWGSMNLAGDQIVFFEEGDVIYERDARTYYAAFDTKIKKLNLGMLLGTTKYRLKRADDKTYRQNELTARLGYEIAKNLGAFATFDRTFKAQPRYPAMMQISAGLVYSF